jgi:Kef-type K+ transport system membrane component KefB
MQDTITHQPIIVLGLMLATVSGKFLASFVTGKYLKFKNAEILTMASLSLPQMAATLASAVVGYKALNSNGERLLDIQFVNAVVILVIFTCVIGPILTERFAKHIKSD